MFPWGQIPLGFQGFRGSRLGPFLFNPPGFFLPYLETPFFGLNSGGLPSFLGGFFGINYSLSPQGFLAKGLLPLGGKVWLSVLNSNFFPGIPRENFLARGGSGPLGSFRGGNLFRENPFFSNTLYPLSRGFPGPWAKGGAFPPLFKKGETLFSSGVTISLGFHTPFYKGSLGKALRFLPLGPNQPSWIPQNFPPSLFFLKKRSPRKRGFPPRVFFWGLQTPWFFSEETKYLLKKRDSLQRGLLQERWGKQRDIFRGFLNPALLKRASLADQQVLCLGGKNPPALGKRDSLRGGEASSPG